MKEREEVAVVTGAARGIGRRVALVLAEEGFRIVANDLAAPEETSEELRSAGAKTLSVPGDVSDEAEVREMAGAVMGASTCW
jgi:NAD(P)-dependent dehydrogenase (short-subunit alcohol dehydrogenase family)